MCVNVCVVHVVCVHMLSGMCVFVCSCGHDLFGMLCVSDSVCVLCMCVHVFILVSD